MSSIENNYNYDSDNDTQVSVIDSTFDEATTDPDYENIEEVDLGEGFVNENLPLYVHQKQLITKMFDAEQEGPIETEEGSFYSRLGAVALKPNSGKTAAAIGLCLAVPSLDKPEESMLGWSSSLVSMKLKSDDTRGYIETSVVICPNTLVDTWASNCDKFYGEGYYYIVKNNTEMTREADKDGKVIGAGNDVTLKELTKKITSLKGKEKRGTIKPEEKELLPLLIEQKEKLKGSKKKVSSKDKIEDLGTIDFLVEKMNSYPIIICPASSFASLIPVFKEYEVTRLLLDELQKTTLTHQDYMKGYKTNPILEYLNSRKGSTTSNRELSPARFIWLITATPHQLEKHEKGHFFNSWISRNAPFLKDYTNSNGNYMFPEMLCRYVIKFPDSYVSRFLNKIKGEKVTIKIKIPGIVTVLNGVMGDDFDSLLQNDNIEGVMKKLNLEGVSIDDPKLELKIITATQSLLKQENDEIRRVESAYKNGGTSSQLENNRARIRENEIKIARIERKMNILNSISALNSGEDLTEEEENYLECSICMEGPSESESLMACPKCWGLCHDKCSLKWFKMQGFQKTCPKCICRINSVSDMCVFKVNVDEDGNQNFEIKDESKQESDRSSKSEAIIDIVGENDDDFLRSNGGKVPERDPDTTDLDFEDIRKTIIFLNDTTESTEEVNLIRGLLDNGIAIFYDKAFSINQAIEKYGPKAKNLMKFVKDKKKIQKFVDEFEGVNRKAVFILRKGSASTGLNFPFVDAIVTYSTFSSDDMKQIIGRAEREGRVRKFFFINLEYV